jgi:hypothetical protein
MRNYLSALFLLFSIIGLRAQTPAAVYQKVALSGQVKLADVPDDYMASVYLDEAPFPGGNSDKVLLKAIKMESAARYPRKAGKTNEKSLVPVPQVMAAYDVHGGTGIPPDNYLAVSDSGRLTSVINSSIYVYQADSGSLLYNKSLSGFTNGLGLSTINGYRFDPKVIFDPLSNRFIAVVLSGTNQYSNLVLAFSHTADPAGEWNLYKHSGNPFADSTWFDYPAIAITENEFFLTGNQLRYNSSWQTGFSQTIIYQINKASGYSGDSLVMNLWSDIDYVGRPIRNLHPVKGGGSIKGPEQFFLSNRNFAVQNDSIFIVKINGEIGSPACSLSITHTLTDLPYGAAPNGRQKNTSKTLATNDGRVLGAFVEGDEIQFVSNSVDTLNGNAAIYHGKITGMLSGNYSVSGTLISIDSLDFGYPNITYVEPGTGGYASLISFNHSGPNRFPGFSVLYYDGSSHSDILPLKEGLTYIDRLSQTEQRWGDYSGSQRLWSVPGVVWVEGIYGKGNAYGCHAVKIGSYNADVNEYENVPFADLKVFPNPADQWMHIDFQIPESGEVRFVLRDMSGRQVGVILERNCQKGKNILTFNTNTLRSGIFSVSMEVAGKTLMVQKFVKP